MLEKHWIDQVAFELTLARIMALAYSEHTMSFTAPRSRRDKRVDIRAAKEAGIQ